MGVSLDAQAQDFLASLLLGAALALLYDLLRAIRLRRKASGALTGALDALYCLLLALLSFFFALRIGGGELRLFMLLSALLGAVLYFALLARCLRPLWAFWADVLFALLARQCRSGCSKNFMVNLPNFAKGTFFFPATGL